MRSGIRLFIAGCALALVIVPSVHAAQHAVAKRSANTVLDAAATNKADGNPILNSSTQRRAAVLRAQILLD